MLLTAVGHSEDVDTKDAILEVLEQCRAELDGAMAQAGILYSAMDHDHKVLVDEINKLYPGIQLIGGTMDGEMSSKIGFTEDSVTLTLFYSDDVDIHSGVADNIPEDMTHAIPAAIEATQGLSRKEAKLCFMIPVSITASGTVIVKEFRRSLGEKFPIFGVSASDQWEFKQTYQFYNTKVLEDSVPFLIFSGPILYGSGVETGWTPKGDFVRITKVEGHIVHEIDGKSAADFYQEFIGEDLAAAGIHPLAVFENQEDPHFYLRAPLTPNYEDGSMVFAADLYKNALVKITFASTESILAACEQAINRSKEDYPGKKPAIAICTSCAARKQILGTKTSKELMLANQGNPDFKVIGCYGFGEIAPVTRDKTSHFHNETFVSLLIGTE